MSYKQKITSDIIITASIELLRSGQEFSARNVARQIGCSTQPIYSLFEDMKDLESQVCLRIDKIQQKITDDYLANENIPPYKAIGMGFIKFARDEKKLFEFLYFKKFANIPDIFHDNYLSEETTLISQLLHIDKKTAFAFHNDMIIFTYGLATMQYLGLNLNDDEISTKLSNQFFALCKLYNIQVNYEQNDTN